MAKTFTLSTTVSKSRLNPDIKTDVHLPSEDTMRLLIGYSRALQVLGNGITGKAFLILN